MLSPVQFDDELELFAEEIEDVPTKRHLTTKFEALKGAVPQPQPQSLFRLGRIAAQSARPNERADCDRTESAQ
jgi:hypothetical protein